MSETIAIKTANSVRRFRVYPRYKDSGIEWLGEIPEHWEVRKLKYITSTVFSNVDKHTVDGETTVRLCNYIDVYYNEFISEDIKFMEATAKPIEIAKFKIQKGDVIITKDSESWDDIAVPAYVATENSGVLCGYHLALIRPRDRLICGKYLFRSFRTSGINDQFKVAATGVTRFGLGKYWLDNGLFLVPPIAEQRSIASFLDHETKRIDSLIAKKQHQIELLQEKRSALISHTVTKGLDPNVKMKDSGIEWMGEIPEHWDVVPLRGVLRQRGEYNDGPRTTNILSVVKDVGVINYDEREASGNKKSDNIEQYKIIHEGDIVLNRMNVIIGSVGIAKEFGAASIEYYVLYAKDDSAYTNYYGYIFSSRAFQTNLGRLGAGILGHRLRIPFEILKKEQLPQPPIAEQQAIAFFLDREIEHIDILINKVKESIEKLREYRTALISAAVTGKIDMRREVAK